MLVSRHLHDERPVLRATKSVHDGRLICRAIVPSLRFFDRREFQDDGALDGLALGHAKATVRGIELHLLDAAAAEPLMAVMPRLVNVRLDEARAHLLQTTLQLIVLETAEDGLGASLVIGRLGYETDTALSRAFRRSEGIAPGEWRRNGRPDRSNRR
jgi:AraC-like DNA-binding protein